jgi:hypothetical protein
LKEWVQPLGGGRDDAAAIQAAMARMAGGGRVMFAPGEYTVRSSVAMPSSVIPCANPGVRIFSKIPPSGSLGSPDNAVFKAVPAAYTRETTLAADTVFGTRTIVLTDASGFAAGDEIALCVSNYLAWYPVVGKAGNTLSLGRMVLHHFPSGTRVVDRVAPKDIRFYCNGMTVDGSGDAVFEFSTGVRCLVDGLRVTAETGRFDHVLVNFDVSSIYCTFRDFDLDAGSTDAASGATSGFHFECGEGCRAERGFVRRPRLQGWLLTAGYGNVVDQVHVEESQNRGGAVSTADTIIGGGKAATIANCTFVGNAGIGLDVQGSAQRVKVVACEARHNGGYGFVANVSGGTGATDCHFDNCNSSRNQGGFYVAQNCSGTTITSCIADNCALYGYTIDGCALLSAVASRECATGGVFVGATGIADVSQAVLSRTSDGPWTAFTSQGTSVTPNTHRPLSIRGARITMGGSDTKIAISGQADAVIYAESVYTIGGTYGWIAGSVGRMFLRGPDVHMSSCMAPHEGGTMSFGTVTLNGDTPVELAFPAATATDRPRARRVSVYGTPGPYTVTVAEGVGFIVTGTDGDMSILEVDGM